LNAGHARELRDALTRYVNAARWAGSSARKPARGTRGPVGGLNTTQIREWARAQGIEVKARGRVPAVLVAHIKAATGQQG
jgi:nucleoid-associated protein Lsr2